MDSTRQLIVNADDFGLSHGVNRGIIEAHEQGIVTSASLMVQWPAAVEAATYAGEHPDLSLGLHIDLGEWIYRGAEWVHLYEVVSVDDGPAVNEEITRQLDAFRRLVGKDPTHLDSHQHVHLNEPVHTMAAEIARKLKIPLRDCDADVQYCGYFYGQTANGCALPEAVSVDGLLRILSSLPPGVTEIGCHAGLEDDLETMYRSERIQEVRTLCDPRVRSALASEGIELISFSRAFIDDRYAGDSLA
jgi:predicted glycoside hydrolase/deacetylase ChbG (UPF0249 family)